MGISDDFTINKGTIIVYHNDKDCCSLEEMREFLCPPPAENLCQDEYRCAECGKIYKKGWTDEEAMEELGENFPGRSIGGCIIVCDDCYNEFME